MTSDRPRLKVDMHVHSYHSGYTSHLRFLRTRDCYSDPEDVYRVAKARGMDLVTITDHDSIDGCLEFLERHPDAPDFFISEEIECRMPGLPLKVHIGAYGIDERAHAEVQRLRGRLHDVVAFLRAERVFCTLNHLFFFYRNQLPLDRYVDAMLRLFTAFETRNGAMLPAQNELITELLEARLDSGIGGAAEVGGSDAHTLRRIGWTYTEADGRTRDEFFESLRAGRTSVAGRHGSTWDIAAEIYGVVACYWQALAGWRRHDLGWPRRVLGAGWSLASLPAEFVPLLIAIAQKQSEARKVAAFRRRLFGGADAAMATPETGQP